MGKETPTVTHLDTNKPEDCGSSTDWASIFKSLENSGYDIVNHNRDLLVQADARVALSVIPADSVSCTITSPPYGNLKDYGAEGQIGYGQHREEEYLRDLESILAELFRVTKPGGSLWLVLDTVKDSGVTIPLPWLVAMRAQNAGWTFHDLVIWDKGKSLPWSNPGRFRGVCEYILLLGKGKFTHFDVGAVRESDYLSPYWVKYPERYHPDGKAPSDLWHFPIPNQGTWGKGQSRHYCPFPLGLVARMIVISTCVNDIVFDPFSGTGSVIAVASQLNRYGVGIEVNSTYVKSYDESGYAALVERTRIEMPKGKNGSTLRHSIIGLRMLKYPKTLYNQISRSDRLGGKAREHIGAFFLRSALMTQTDDTEALDSGDLGCITLDVLLRADADSEAVTKEIEQQTKVAPLTIFGIRAKINIVEYNQWTLQGFLPTAPDNTWYIYRKGTFYRFDAEINACDLDTVTRAEASILSHKIPSILSNLKVDVESPAWD